MKTYKVTTYKGLVDEVTITSGVGLVVLAGDNKQGKSSFLDAVREVLRFAGTRETPEPIHQGADEASVEIIDHDRDRRYVRTFRRSKTGKVTSELAVYAIDGAKYSNPAEILAQDVGAEIIDAGEFARMSARDQRDALLRQIELPFDLDEIAREKAGAEGRRLEAGREVKRLQSVLASLDNPLDAPNAEVSAHGIFEQIQAAQGLAHTHEQEQMRLDEMSAESARMAAQIADLTGKFELLASAIRAQTASIAELPPVPDVAPLQAQLVQVDEINRGVRARKEYAKVADEYAGAETAQASAQRALDQIDERKRAGLAAAAFPDPLLSFDEAGVLYDGVPFSQLNDADKRIVGARILVGASDRALRIGFVREGDLLDDDSLERLRQVAVDADYTFMVERGRDSSRDRGYCFNEGTLVEAVA